MFRQRTRVLDPKSLIMVEHKGVTYESMQAADGKGLLASVTFSGEFAKELYAEGAIPIIFAVPEASSAKLVCKIKNSGFTPA